MSGENNTATVTPIQAEGSHITVVDSSNFHEYVDQQLGIVKDTPEQAAEKELAKVESEKADRLAEEAAKDDPTHDLGESVPKDKKGKLNERFRELTEKRKAAEEAAATAAADAKAAREAREQAEADAAALRAKYEPVKAEPDPEPNRSQFASDEDFTKALKEWTADDTRRQDAKKAEEAQAQREREAIGKAWQDRVAKAKEAIPDYEKIISESEVRVSDQIRDAIVESEVGPQLLVHFAQNPEVAKDIGKMTVAKALVALGKLEATLGGQAKPAPKSEADLKVAHISKAPAPISPLTGSNAPPPMLKGTDAVPAGMSYDDWKAQRQAGRVK